LVRWYLPIKSPTTSSATPSCAFNPSPIPNIDAAADWLPRPALSSLDLSVSRQRC